VCVCVERRNEESTRLSMLPPPPPLSSGVFYHSLSLPLSLSFSQASFSPGWNFDPFTSCLVIFFFPALFFRAYRRSSRRNRGVTLMPAVRMQTKKKRAARKCRSSSIYRKKLEKKDRREEWKEERERQHPSFCSFLLLISNVRCTFLLFFLLFSSDHGTCFPMLQFFFPHLW
jgi:hypothetical protein